MKNTFILLLAIIVCHTVEAQNEPPNLDTEILRSYTHYFSIKDNTISGEGKSVIEAIANQSQFVVYGEMHGSNQTSIFNKAFIPLLSDAGFKYFAIEVGPHSATKLAELSTPASKTVENLNSFYSKYTVVQGEEVAEPIPFFTSISDAEFLKEARVRNMQLWGLDQEFYFSAFFLMDELTKTAKEHPNYSNIVSLQNQAKAIMFKHFLAEFKNEIDGAYSRIKKEKVVRDYFDAFDKSNEKAQALIKDLIISWDIYINWRNDSHVDRISYMRNNFMSHYNQATKKERQPKVFTKIGSLHAKKTFSNGAYDIGELVESLAQKNGTVATTINSWKPYEIGSDGKIIDNFERYKRGYKRYKVFMPLAKQDSWGIINLKAIREALENNEIQLPKTGDYHKLKNLIYGYDFQLLLPVDEDPVPNRSN
ncbi:hypothetical protein [uncultured Psychroserpens sp.]|uniref:hypothetical protein n=1 Tax=uncultured Psychroserpens sp. TaxID=255436 RepID=UPI00260B2E4B|nr:hypothetical protein [uncultured Psychroserpens sp.]